MSTARQQAYYSKNKTKLLAYQKRRRALLGREPRINVAIRNREIIVCEKSRPCFDCGVQYNPWIMQFDHRDPLDKRFGMSEKKGDVSIRTLAHEISKCDVVCANCHAERTHVGKHWLIKRKNKLAMALEDPQGVLPFHDLTPRQTPQKQKGVSQRECLRNEQIISPC